MRRVSRLFLMRLHQSWFVMAWCVGVIAGAVLAVIFRVNYFVSPVWLVFSILLLVVTFVKPLWMFVVLAFLAGMITVFFRAASELGGEQYISAMKGQEIVVAGVVDGDPETDEKKTNFKISELEFGDDGTKREGTVYVTVYENEDLARGDIVTLKGQLDDGFGTYAGKLYMPKVIKWERPVPGNLVVDLRNWFAERIARLIPEPENKLGLSYLLGMKTGLPDDLALNLRMVGLTHIVVASGAHLSILVEIARKVFGRLSRFAGLMFSVIFIVFFMAMVGWTPSIMRAGIMAILTLVTWYVGRKIEPLRMIVLVAAITLMISPMFLTNLGWLLSFTSYIGIMILGPKLTKVFYGRKKPGFVASTIMMTIAATMMTLPIVLYYYGAVSLISVMANLLILPTLGYAMGLVFFTGTVAGVPGVEVVAAKCATLVLDFHIYVVEFFAKMEQFLVTIEPYQSWVFLIYVLVFLPLAWQWWRKRIKKRAQREMVEKEVRETKKVNGRPEARP